MKSSRRASINHPSRSKITIRKRSIKSNHIETLKSLEYGDLIEISSIHINELKGSSKEDKSKLSPQGKKLLTIIESSKSERYKNLINVEVSSALKRKMNKISEEHDGESLLAELSKVE